jgi:endonuclease YncB( thermonuclease family)
MNYIYKSIMSIINNNKKDDLLLNNTEIQTITEEEKIFTELSNIKNPKDIPYFSFSGKTFYAKHCNIYDGDTFSAIFIYKDELIKYRCRCMGYDTAEMKPLKSKENREEEKNLAINAKKRFEELLNKHPTNLIKIDCLEFDKYGRILVNVWNNVDSKSVNEIMIEEGHGKKYSGGTKEEW